MAVKLLPPQSRLLQLLRYEPDSGMLFWRERPVELFVNAHDANVWNTRFAGRKAFATVMENGYHVGTVGRSRFYAHRIIWRIMTGEEPKDIDHIDGDRANNRFENLRNVNRSENLRNASLPSTNTSGVIGVVWAIRNRKWHAQGKLNGVQISIGHFIRFKDAVAARKRWERKNGFHINHGRVKLLTSEDNEGIP